MCCLMGIMSESDEVMAELIIGLQNQNYWASQSCGIAIISETTTNSIVKKGLVCFELNNPKDPISFPGQAGIGHVYISHYEKALNSSKE